MCLFKEYDRISYRMKIGYTNPHYATYRNIIDVVDGAIYQRVRPLNSLVMKLLPASVERKYWKTLLNAYLYGIGQHKVDLLHFFNITPLFKIGKPYVTTFETALPRFNQALNCLNVSRGGVNYAFNTMASSRCRKLIAISDDALKRQKRVFEANGLSDVCEKLVVMHPPQKLLTTEEVISHKYEKPHPLHFVYVGKSFYRKGGAALLQVLAKLHKDFDFKLTLIGDLASMEWREDVRIDHADQMQKLLNENSTWITFYNRLPNEQVLALLKEADVGFLPTRGDTYGYSVLEMQACGLPCVTTNLSALPEINNEEIGWIIPLVKNEFGEEVVKSFEDLVLMDEMIRRGLEKACVEILSHPEQVHAKTLASFRAVEMRNDPIVFAERMRNVYQEALEL